VKCAPWVGKFMQLPPGVKYAAVTAGFGAGKTHGGVQNHYYWSTCVNRRSPSSLWVEPDSILCKNMALPIWEEVLEDGAGLRQGKDFTIYRSYPQEIVLHRNSHHVEHTITLLSGERPEKIVGYNAAHGTIDEPGIQEREVFTRVGSRLRCKEATRIARFLLGTPEGDDNWFAELFDIPPGIAHDGFYRLMLHTRDNIFNPNIEEYIATLEQDWAHSLPKLGAYLAGIFTSFATNKVFSHYGAHLHDPNIAPSSQRPIYLFFDFNAFPLAWSAGQITPSKVLEICASSEGRARRNLADEVAYLLDETFPPSHYDGTPFIVYGDRSGHAGSHKTDFSDYETIERVFRERGRVCEVNTPVTVVPIAGSVDIIERYLARGLIKLHPERAKKLCQSLGRTKWKDNQRVIEKPASDDWTHWGDGLRYGIYWLDQSGDLDYRKKSLSIPFLDTGQSHQRGV